jgi:hypothetical protein
LILSSNKFSSSSDDAGCYRFAVIPDRKLA